MYSIQIQRFFTLAGLALGLSSGVTQAQVTGSTGGSQPLATVQPSLVMTPCIRTSGIFPSEGGAGGVGCLATVTTFPYNFVPSGYAACNGQLLSISQNTAMFALIGTTYGGNGTTNFALPDLRGRVVTGTGTGPGLSSRTTGSVRGSETVTLSATNLPAHTHTVPAPGTNTFITGSGSAFSNLQPELSMNYLIATEGIFPSQGGGGPFTSTEPLLGQVVRSATNVAPGGYMFCQGQQLSIAQNTALFSILGTTYGGNGITTFALPDLRGRAPIGPRQGPGLSSYALGQSSGSETVSLNINQIPSHSHTVTGVSGSTTGTTGGNQAHSTLQPTLGINPIIALGGIFPSQGGGGTADEPYVGQTSLFAGNFAPSGWAFANGQLLPIAQNTALFALLGTTYGGNGTTTFALPDLRGRLDMGVGQGPSLSNRVLGEQVGSEMITMTESTMPAHTHAYPVPEPAFGLLAAAGVAFGLRRFRKR